MEILSDNHALGDSFEISITMASTSIYRRYLQWVSYAVDWKEFLLDNSFLFIKKKELHNWPSFGLWICKATDVL